MDYILSDLGVESKDDGMLRGGERIEEIVSDCSGDILLSQQTRSLSFGP